MSIDSMYVHKMWDDNELSKMVHGGVPFPMLSDAGGRVGQVFGIYDEDAGVETRGRFIIDPEGIVQGYEVLTPPCRAQCQRNDPPGPGFSTGTQHQGKGGHPFGLEAGENDP